MLHQASRFEKICWLIVLISLAIFLVFKCGGAQRRATVTQGAGAQALIAKTVASMPASGPTLPRAVIPPGTNRYYFAATAMDNAGSESDYSTEVMFTNTARTSALTLAWDKSPGTNVITNYNVFWGRASRTYTNKQACGLSLTKTVQLVPPPLTNSVVTVTTTGATNLVWASSLKGPWTKLGVTNWTGTNIAGPRFFRAMKAGSKVLIAGRLL